MGLEATGHFETTCFVENNEYCRAVLRHHWPDVPVLGDICDVRKEDLPCPNPDIVVGGFPCQPFSQAGKQKADKDKRHLWPEMFRLIRECRPTWVVGENVIGFAKLGLDKALTDLENEGYATRTFNIPACAVGAPHRRQRLWIVAHANTGQCDGQETDLCSRRDTTDFVSQDVAHADNANWRRRTQWSKSGNWQSQLSGTDRRVVADTQRKGERRRGVSGSGENKSENGKGSSDKFRGCREAVADPDYSRNRTSRRRANRDGQKIDEGQAEQPQSQLGRHSKCITPEEWWEVEPSVGRLVDGLPNRVSQLRALGNSIVPQIAQKIGEAIRIAHDV